MKTLLKCIFFTLLILKISNASAYSYLYLLHNSSFMITICDTNSSIGHIRTCKDILPTYLDLPLNIDKIVISPNGADAYITTRPQHPSYSSKVYACLIDNRTGYFQHCTHREFPKQEFGNIADIIVNATSDKFYVLFTHQIDLGFNVKDMRNHYRYENQMMMCSSKTFECSQFDKISIGVINFIRLSSDNRYAYLISKDIIDDKPEYEFYACPIQPDGTFNHNSCHITKLNLEGVFSSIWDIAVAKNGVYLAVYQVQEHNVASRNIIYYPIENSGASLGAREDSVTYPEFQPVQITLDSTDKYAYLLSIYDGRNSLLRCMIVGTNFQNCMQESKYTFASIKNIKYRRDRPNDDSDVLTLHFEPKVESK